VSGFSPASVLETLMRILVTFAVEAEFAAWRALRDFRRVRVSTEHWSGGVDVLETTIDSNSVWIYLTGIGIKCFGLRQDLSFQAARVDAAVSSGLAGALRTSYSVGDIIAARRVGTTRDASGIPGNAGLLEFARRSGARLADVLLTANHIVATVEEKKSLSLFADVVDMESVHIMDAFRNQNVPCVTIRAISDGSDEDLPINFSRAVRNDGSLRVGALIGELVKRPTKVPDLVRFGQRSRNAAQKLVAFLDRFVESLTPEGVTTSPQGVAEHE
jgi:nucleoside phosphorylase